MTLAPVNHEMIIWALKRSGHPLEAAKKKFAKFPEWKSGEKRPTVKQAESFAKWTHVPFGYLFLSAPPKETIPIPDFRTVPGQDVKRLSPDLLDMIHACQERQDWYRDYMRETEEPKFDFVGSADLKTSPETVAAQMREALGFKPSERRPKKNWENALRALIKNIEEAGVLVMVSGVVMSNNHRKLEVEEFRGFALCDPRAPLIFINGSDAKPAQMFTLAHELAHIWLGKTALSKLSAKPREGYRVEEVWCNKVAAEFLVPLDDLKSELWEDEPFTDAKERLRKHYTVSTLVMLRRMLDVGKLSRADFNEAWGKEIESIQASDRKASNFGGNFYNTTLSRVGRRFARALISSTYEGRTLYRDAFRMLGVSKTQTLNELMNTAEPTE